jgi:predicted metal-dependent enzyme (double-stranded beta helix superfamily)
MSPADLGTTNVWLALIAISSVLQLLIVIALLAGSYRFFRRMEKAVDRISDELIAPVSARAHKFIDEAEDLMARARSFDEGVRRTLSRVGDGVGVASTVVKHRFWPVIGLLRGVKAGLATLAQSPAAPPARPARATVTRLAPKDASDVEAEQRFAYEGGTSHARS